VDHGPCQKRSGGERNHFPSKSQAVVLWISLPDFPGVLICSVVSCICRWGSSIFTSCESLTDDTFCYHCF
jgi:hypothetical protein